MGEGMEQRCKFEKLQWNMAQERAFRRLKEALTEAPVLTQLDLDTPSTIGTGFIGLCNWRISHMAIRTSHDFLGRIGRLA
jgi:hypothetical protein